MAIIKLVVFITVIEFTLGSDVEQIPSPTPTPSPATLTNEIVQTAQKIHLAFVDKEGIEPSSRYRYGYQIHDPETGTTTSQYEIRYSEVTLGTYTRVAANGSRSTVSYTVDATNGYRPTLTVDPPGGEDVTLDYARLASPLATATPPSDREVNHRFIIDDREGIDKHSRHAEFGYRTHVNFKHHLNVLPTFRYSLGYEVKGADTRSQYERYRDGVAKGRVTRVDVDGCVSSMDYSVEDGNLTVSAVHAFTKTQMLDLYLYEKHDALLRVIDLASSKCDG